MLELDGIDFIAGVNKDGNIEVINKNGIGIISGTDSISYTYTGVDPLKYDRSFDSLNKEQILAETINSHFPDGLLQLKQIFMAERAGDIVISASPGFDLRSHYEFKEHFATHGALCSGQMLVPFLSNHAIEKEYLRTTDIFDFMKGLTVRES